MFSARNIRWPITPNSTIQAKDTMEGAVIHAIAEYIEFGDADLHCIDYLQHVTPYSAHYFITPSGLRIHTADETMMCAHARGANYGTIGIEIMVGGCHTYESFSRTIAKEWLTKGQRIAVIELIKDLRSRYGWGIDAFRRHSDISPGRKIDPGKGFPFKDILCDAMLGPENPTEHRQAVDGHIKSLAT